MEQGETSTPPEEEEGDQGTQIPAGLSEREYQVLKPIIDSYHNYGVSEGQCSSLMVQRIYTPLHAVWTFVRSFDKPQVYKHFIKSCHMRGDLTVGCLREVNVISGLPATTSTERLDILDDEQHVMGFSIIGGEHRLRNYRSVTTVNEFEDDGKIWAVVLESYVVDVPEGNTEEDTRLFADTVVRLNLQKLATAAQSLARDEKKKKKKKEGDWISSTVKII